MALAALDSGIMTPFALENVELYNKYGSVEAAVAAGKEFHMWAKPFVDSYIYLGGTGSTLGLIIAIFIASRREDYRQVAKLATPSGIFQINEPILFGLPVIMNPVMFIPFILVQPVLTIITSLAYYSGLIPPITNIAPWTMPVGLGGVLQHQRQHHGPVAEPVQPGGRHRDLSAVRGDLQQGAEPDRRGDGKRRRHRQGAEILTVGRGGVAAPRGTRVWNINLPTGSGGAAPPPAPQSEGAAARDGKSRNIFDYWYEIAPERFHDRVGPGEASTFYDHFRTDIGLLKTLGHNTFRTSISWSRLIPDGDGEVNPQAVAFYNAMIEELLAQGITPVYQSLPLRYAAVHAAARRLGKTGRWSKPMRVTPTFASICLAIGSPTGSPSTSRSCRWRPVT